MLYLFTWNSPYLINEALKKWKNQFIEKYGDFNFVYLKDLENINKNILAENLLWTSFLAENKLIIVDFNNDTKEDIETFFISNLENIPKTNIVIFNFPNPDKRKKIYKELKKYSELKEFNLQEDDEIYNFIAKKYKGKIANTSINTIINYKGKNIEKIISEIDKLLITKDFIEKDDILENIKPELEESIFQVIDDLLNIRKIEALKKINIILTDTNIYAFYNNLLANLRTSLFIMKMKKIQTSPLTPLLAGEGNNKINISKVLDLKNRSFLVNKNYKINYKSLEEFYINLINIDKKMKSGKLVWSEENDLKLEIEKSILSIK